MSQPALSLTARNLGKRHGRSWIWRGVECNLEAGGTLALLGSNGSGKAASCASCVASMPPSEGQLDWTLGGLTPTRDTLPGHIAYCAPDQALIQDFTVEEHMAFHRACRIPSNAFTLADLLDIAMLKEKGQPEGECPQLWHAPTAGLDLGIHHAFRCTVPRRAHLPLGRPRQGMVSKPDRSAPRRPHLVVASNHDAEEVPSGADSVTLGLNG